MTRTEADRLFADTSGRLCVRIQRRADGTVVTQDCGPLRRAVRRKALLLRTAAAAFLALLFPAALTGCGAEKRPDPDVVPPEDMRQLQGEVCPPMMGTPVAPPAAEDPEPEMGDVAIPQDPAPHDAK